MTETKRETFIVTVEPVNDFITTEDLGRKLKLVCGGCGIKLHDLKKITAEDQAREYSEFAISLVDAMEQLVTGAMDLAASDGAQDEPESGVTGH